MRNLGEIGGDAVKLDRQTGWLEDVRRVPSPHCDERPAGSEVDLLVIHGISLPPGGFGGPYIDQLFTNTLDPSVHPYFAEIVHVKASAHVLIRRDGSLTQYVSFYKRAWHAGVSCFNGRNACNDFSIGIELEGCDDEIYEAAQYEALVHLTKLLMSLWPGITKERIVGHCDIAPERKTDPGPRFDWERYLRLL
ncbi:MAG: 1,6-anhydro-N-acetylmuramyl-L-alanine amidase AmpD [Gammaproteobacteria bacterium]|nr:1,6-anhydro-N-acetylmuramyl-L-alanine amidase AmpD [Gammaproteobacteria bacterium]MCI0591730.1 1,6-anhydro-N-acetylmuramyl-L-alanine amidase AmpD [Gammaproteobacteria bacterium]